MRTSSYRLKTRLQLQMLRSLHARKGLQKGFTLVELMIVVAIVGILSAVALPQFLQARNAAQAGASIGEALGLAKECATAAASDIEIGTTAPAGANVTADPANGSCTSGGTFTATWASGISGIRCLNQTSATTDDTATITVADTGQITCVLS